jgi:hypothetical protein
MQIITLLIITLTILADTQASDLNPPDWRGEPGSTYQQWDFHYEQETDVAPVTSDCSKLNFIETSKAQLTQPDIMNNPYVDSTGICVEFKSLWFITKRLDWLRSYFNREGIWSLQNDQSFENFLNFIIPNADINENTSTVLQAQIIYHTFSGPPKIDIRHPLNIDGSTVTITPVKVSLETELPDEWKHSSTTYVVPGCPRYESIFIYPTEHTEIYIDSISIDTICTKDPDSLVSG